ncbi:MAG: aminopeptidase P N-terminal domain-containing protein [Polyangiaceae bacterium]
MLSVYAERRRRVLDSIGSGTLIVFAAPTFIRNHDVEHEYRQDSDFYYLTGLDEPESVLVLGASEDAPFLLFVRPKDPVRETWDGERIGVDGAVAHFGANAAFPIGELPNKLVELLKGKDRLFYALGRHEPDDAIVLGALRRIRERARRGDKGPQCVVEPGSVLHEMRLFKDDTEVESLRRAIEVTREGHHALFERTRAGMGENELDGILRERFRSLGSERCAYTPIVASGRNARILHHRRNDRVFHDGELILVDAGAEYGYQSADITRTYPVSGRFSDAQRRAYEIVLAAQASAIEAARPGKTLDDVHHAACRVLCSGLIDLGILSGSIDELIDSDAFRRYYMHRTSHWLGMDVHDVGDYFVDGKPRPLQPGMVITVEPGLYFDASDPSVPEGLRDVGIRIEDDVLITASGASNLSESIAKSVFEIEGMMQSLPRAAS